MKLSRIALSLFAFAFFMSCSTDTVEETTDIYQEEVETGSESENETDTNTDSESETEEENEPITEDAYFTYTYDGQEINIEDTFSQRSENALSVQGWNKAGNNIQLQFNAFGNLSGVTSFSSEFAYPSSYSYEYYKSNYFDFELVNIDPENKKVEVTFEGILYEDLRDLNSEQHKVSGSFITSYIDVQPTIAEMGTYAKINGTDWHATDSQSAGGFFSGSNITLINFNDGEYALYFTFNHDTTEPGVYEFSEDDTTNVITIGKYIVSEDGDGFIPYKSSGTLTVTEKTTSLIPNIKGTFSFTATHPENGSKITVANGTFNEVYAGY